MDLSCAFDLGRRFDVVQCLELAEHLAEHAADGLIESIVRHGDVVLFSAAVPGQGGTHHRNEQPLQYWRETFDALRPRIYRNPLVEPWYRFNSLIYANTAGRRRLSAEVLRSEVALEQSLQEYASWPWQMRKAVVRLLPYPVVDRLARVNGMIVRMRPDGGS
jgi:hypothetical protein